MSNVSVPLQERMEMKENKAFLIEAIARKAHAQIKNDNKKDLDRTLKHLSKWVDIEKDKKYAAFTLQRYEHAKQYGLMLKLLNSLLEKKGDETKDSIAPMTKNDIISKRIEVLKALNYNNLAERDQSWSRSLKATKDFALF